MRPSSAGSPSFLGRRHAAGSPAKQSYTQSVGAGSVPANAAADTLRAAGFVASQAGHRLPALSAEQNKALATPPADELPALPLLQSDRITDPLHAYQIAKRANPLRVLAEAVRWGKCGARIDTIGPGIVITPLARDELIGPRGTGDRRMLEQCAVGRPGTADEVGNDFLMDGGVTAAYWLGDLAPR